MESDSLLLEEDDEEGLGERLLFRFLDSTQGTEHVRPRQQHRLHHEKCALRQRYAATHFSFLCFLSFFSFLSFLPMSAEAPTTPGSQACRMERAAAARARKKVLLGFSARTAAPRTRPQPPGVSARQGHQRVPNAAAMLAASQLRVVGASPRHLHQQVARPIPGSRSARVASPRLRSLVLAAKKSDAAEAKAPAPAAVVPAAPAPAPVLPSPADTSIYAMPLPGEGATCGRSACNLEPLLSPALGKEMPVVHRGRTHAGCSAGSEPRVYWSSAAACPALANTLSGSAKSTLILFPSW